MSATGWLRIKARAGRVLLAFLVLSALAGVLWYRRLAGIVQQEAPAGAPASDSKAEMVISDFRHVETRMDRVIWVLESDRAEVFEDRASLHGVKVTWYGEPGAITMIITSAAGTVDFRLRNAELHGSVRVARADGAVLETEKILWDDATKLLQAPMSVVISTPTFTFRGESLEANTATEHVTLRGRVRGEIRGGSPGRSQPS
jgi:LPS export ABC transporter protein LptC